METISYRKGYKYQISADYFTKISISPEKEIITDYIKLNTEGGLLIKKGYAWDGPSGPTVDTSNFMRSSLVHDALYQLMREKHLKNIPNREIADKLLYKMSREDGMSRTRAWWVYIGVRFFANFAADPANKKPIEIAPRKIKSSNNNEQ